MDIYTVKKGDKLRLQHRFPSNTSSVVTVNRVTDSSIWILTANHIGKGYETRFTKCYGVALETGRPMYPLRLHLLQDGDEAKINSDYERHCNLYYLNNCGFQGLSNEALTRIVKEIQEAKKKK